MTDTETVGPWFRGEPKTSGHSRICAVCRREIKPGQTMIVNWELRACAHVGCGTVPPRKPAREKRRSA